MNKSVYYPEQPGLVKTVAILTLVNGIVNIFWGLVATAAVVPTIILACLAIFTILPTILGIFEIIYAAKLLSDPPQPVQPSQTIAILEILCILTGNVFSMIVGILVLVFYNDEQVKTYFAELNGIPYPVDITPATPPAPPADPKPAPATPETPVTPETPEEPKPEKPRPRKVADKGEAGKESGKEAKSG